MLWPLFRVVALLPARIGECDRVFVDIQAQMEFNRFHGVFVRSCSVTIKVRPMPANLNAGRVIAVGFAMSLSYRALLFGLLCAVKCFNEPSVQHRHLNVVTGFPLFLSTFWPVYRFGCTDEFAQRWLG